MNVERLATTIHYWVFICVLALFAGAGAQAVTLEAIISREHPQFTCSNATLAMGRDGKIYVTSGGYKGFVIRLDRDGTHQDGTLSGNALGMMTANKAGIMGASRGHFTHAITIHDQAFQQVAVCNDFWNGDTRWGAPSSVAAGETDFYGVDSYRNRILRLNPNGKPVHIYAVPALKQNESLGDLRVDEARKCLYINNNEATLRCLTFDGVERWQLRGVQSRLFDLDDAGLLYYLIGGPGPKVIQVIGEDGKPVRKLTLQVPEERMPAPNASFTSLCVWGDELFIRRASNTELFQVYSLADGHFLRAVDIHYERMTAEFPSYVLPTGGTVPLQIACRVGDKTLVRAWRVEIAPYGTNWWRTLAWDGKTLSLPADTEGLYALRITGPSTEYLLREVVTLRKADAAGTLSVWTPTGRIGYARGEQINATLSLRAAAADARVPATAGLYPDGSTTAIWTAQAVMAPGTDVQLTVPAAVTAAAAPGRYRLRASGGRCSAADQPIEIGAAHPEDPAFFTVMYGDYGDVVPNDASDPWNSITPAYDGMLQRLGVMGFNLSVSRFGSNTELSQLQWDYRLVKSYFTPLAQRLGEDTQGVDPRRAEIAAPRVHAMGAQSAEGVKEMAIANYMDAGLPMWKGIGNDGRTQAQYVDAITKVTQTMLPYSSFRGWAWIANWWEYNPDVRFTTPEEKATYSAARKQADDTGAWDPIIDTVDSRFYDWPAEAHAFMKKTAEEAQAGSLFARPLVNASSGPVRRPHTYAPIYYRNLDEVDLHFQCEQIGTPLWTGFAVDYYHRPNKPSWVHPEFMNDLGDGQQTLPLSWLALMRGVDGIGTSGNMPHWGRQPLDGRSAAFGLPSVMRALNHFVTGYGPWLRSLQGADRIAIMGCPRMALGDKFVGTMGQYYSRLFAASLACQYARQPAAIIYPEDMTTAELVRRFKAVLVVSQRVEMEPKMAAMLHDAQARGVKLFADASCRPECVKGFTPLPVGFDSFEKIPAMNNDYAYWEYPDYFAGIVPALTEALAGCATPVAKVNQPGVLVSERDAGVLRTFFVVNVTSPPLDPAQLRRVRPAVSVNYPVTATLTLPATGAIYDVLERRLLPAGQPIQANLRYNPGRIYAALPAPIEAVTIASLDRVKSGQPLPVEVHVTGAAGRAIDAPLPVMLRLKDGAGTVVDERPLAIPTAGQRVSLVAPTNCAGPLSLEVTDLLAGKTAKKTVTLTDGAPAAGAPEAGFDWTAQPVARQFGPRLRDVAVSADGRTALLNSFDWGNNLYQLELATGKLLGAHRVGNYYAVNPVATAAGFAVQGQDLNAAVLYHLYLLDGSGKPQRRFALPGVPGRQSIWQVAGMLQDRINNFALPTSGKWVAACGNQALTVWSADGTLRWSHDWSREDRHTMQLCAVGEDTLLATNGITATLLDAATGNERWTLPLSTSGSIAQVAVTPDGRTIALLATTEFGPRVYLVQNGAVVSTIASPGNELLLAPDGERVILLDDTRLKCYSRAGEPLWTVTSLQPLYQARYSPDGARVAVSDDLGLLRVYDRDGTACFTTDLGAYAITAWLPGGDLLAATWMGTASRLAPDGTPRWRTAVDAAPVAEETVPTVAFTPATAQPATASARPNLLTPAHTVLTPQFVSGRSMQISSGPVQGMRWQQPATQLLDGKKDPPATPWIDWRDIVYVESGWRGDFVLTIENTQQLLRVDEVEFVEDPAHPESWIRDARLEYLDVAAEQWKPAAFITANSADHVHKLPAPVTASRFRLVKADGNGWPLGNLRLAEIIFRGEALGSPHPDAVAGKPVATLFDDGDPLFNETYFNFGNNGLKLAAGTVDMPAYSGSYYLRMDTEGNFAAKSPTLDRAVPTWGIPVAEQPAPGEYRYLRFAWRALSDKTTGITVGLMPRAAGDGAFAYAGQLAKGIPTAHASKAAETPPAAWQTATIDLWKVAGGKPFQVGNLLIGCVGGPAAVDAVQLARSEGDFGK